MRFEHNADDLVAGDQMRRRFDGPDGSGEMAQHRSKTLHCQVGYCKACFLEASEPGKEF